MAVYKMVIMRFVTMCFTLFYFKKMENLDVEFGLSINMKEESSNLSGKLSII
jgi:hypothetical protein